MNPAEPHNGRYILVGQTPVAEPDLLTWARWVEEADRRVGLTRVGPYHVSTVFLGLDHSFNFTGRPRPPILFETMVYLVDAPLELMKEWDPLFSTEFLDICERCATWLEAEEQHKRVVGELAAEHGDPVVEIPWREAVPSVSNE